MVSVCMQLAGYGMVNGAHHLLNKVHLITTRLAPNITPATAGHTPPRLNHRRSAKIRIEAAGFEALTDENMRCDAV
jgi:hypothetical protein